MTPDQIELVKSVIAGVGEHPEFAACFYDRLFSVAPQTADMFSDMGSQQRKLTDELGSMVSLLSDIGSRCKSTEVPGFSWPATGDSWAAQFGVNWRLRVSPS